MRHSALVSDAIHVRVRLRGREQGRLCRLCEDAIRVRVRLRVNWYRMRCAAIDRCNPRAGAAESDVDMECTKFAADAIRVRVRLRVTRKCGPILTLGMQSACGCG